AMGLRHVSASLSRNVRFHDAPKNPLICIDEPLDSISAARRVEVQVSGINSFHDESDRLGKRSFPSNSYGFNQVGDCARFVHSRSTENSHPLSSSAATFIEVRTHPFLLSLSARHRDL